ncbi:MAG: hypothetical protein Q9191_003783 [Dirinaria sp. TL-2023a]
MSRATEGTPLMDIAPATSGICFLGTPHRGSRSASIGKIAFRITKAAGMRPNTKILQGLERNSETLDMISDDFSQTVEKYRRILQVHSFREEKLTRKWGMFSTMVVDTDSAKIGLGHERNGSIPAEHSNMTKFSSIEDVGFKRVSAQLRRWVGQQRTVEDPRKNETELISSLWRQLPELWFCVEPEYTKLVRAQGGIKRPIWNLSSLKSILFGIVAQRKIPFRVILFLDALDEHAGDNDELAHILRSMIHKVENDRVILRLCLASRSWNVFEQYFGKYPGLAIHEHTRRDIEVYTRSELEASIDDPKLISSQRLNTLTHQITLKALGVFIWVRLVVEQLAKGIRDGSPYSSLEDEVARMPQKLEDLYANILKRLDSQYIDEAYVMLHVAMSTVEPLPLETFLSAVDYVLRNKRFYTDSKWRIQDAPDLEDSEKAYLRRLASRSGGFLETYVTTSAEYIKLLANQSIVPETRDERQSESTTRIVQFLHATAKEYTREYQDRLLEGNIEPHFIGFNGNDFLLFCSVSCRVWAAPIKKHMLHYAKFTELHTIKDDSAADRSLVLLQTIKNSRAPRPSCDFGWWVDRSWEPLFGTAPFSDPSIPSAWKLLALAVAANAKSLVQHCLDLRAINFATYKESREKYRLLLLAAAGPAFVPIEHQDRIGMIKILLSGEYPIDNYSIPCDTALYYEGHDWIEASQSATPLWYVLMRKLDSKYSEDIQLEIAGYLLTQGANHNNPRTIGGHPSSLLGYCIIYGSAASVHLLLKHGASVNNEYTALGLTSYQYAILRQDKAIMQTLKEASNIVESENVTDTDHEHITDVSIARIGLWIVSGTLQSGRRALKLSEQSIPLRYR